jgi:uncharacterized protein YrzB (UPF0473 family)
MAATEETQIIETIDENGNLVKFELLDIIEFEEKEYALLLPIDAEDDGNDDEEDEIVLMGLIKEGEDYIFEAIEDDDEFNRVTEFIENIEE